MNNLSVLCFGFENLRMGINLGLHRINGVNKCMM